MVSVPVEAFDIWTASNGREPNPRGQKKKTTALRNGSFFSCLELIVCLSELSAMKTRKFCYVKLKNQVPNGNV